jgi:hypothetical protein
MSQADAGAGTGPRCPTCHRPVSWAGNPARPFCSVPCKLVDLGAWLDEAYRIPDESAGRPGDGRPFTAGGSAREPSGAESSR